MPFKLHQPSPAQIAEQFVNHTNRNVFLTGKAGTGKTTFLKHIIASTHKKTIVTAPTGIAALNAGGVTLHSQFQLPLAGFIPEHSDFVATEFVKFETKSTILRHMRMNDIKRQAIKEAELLIIDEVSMLRADILDAVDFVLQHIRRKRIPFGGLQLLFIGDLLQLPPVVKNEEWNTLRNYYESPFFFDSKVLRNNKPVYIELDKIYRQQDRHFTDILNHLRYNQVTTDDVEELNRYFHPGFKPKPSEGYITLTTHNRFADEINQRELSNLKTASFKYEAELENDFPESIFPVERNLILKEGAQVMFIKNDISGEGKFYNGKIGVVKSLEDEKITVKTDTAEIDVARYEWKNIRYHVDEKSREIKEETLGVFRQYPLRLAWAITIHKSQGLTFEKAIIDVSNVFASGQAYVALSRLTSLEGLVLSAPFGKQGIANSADVIRFENSKHLQGEPTEILKHATTEYLQFFCRSVFDFSGLLKEWQLHLATYNKDETHSEKQQQSEWAENIYEQLLSLHNTALKFGFQLTSLFNETPFNIDFLLKRLNAAKDYFEPFLKELNGKVFLHKKKMQAVRGAKAYAAELEELDALLLNRLIDMLKTVLIAESLQSKEFLTKEKWQKRFDLSWRLKLVQTDVAFPERKKKKAKGETYQTTFRLYEEGKTAEEIAEIRNLAITTIHGHLAKLISKGLVDIYKLLPLERIDSIKFAINTSEQKTLGELMKKLDGRFSFGEIKMVLAHIEKYAKAED